MEKRNSETQNNDRECKRLYCDECGEYSAHVKVGSFYCCTGCHRLNYTALEIDNPEEFARESQKLKNLQNKLIAENGFPF